MLPLLETCMLLQMVMLRSMATKKDKSVTNYGHVTINHVFPDCYFTFALFALASSQIF